MKGLSGFMRLAQGVSFIASAYCVYYIIPRYDFNNETYICTFCTSMFILQN